MSWFNASQLSSFAKQALSQAQKSIDRVLDIQEEEPSAWAETIPYGEPGKRERRGDPGLPQASSEASGASGVDRAASSRKFFLKKSFLPGRSSERYFVSKTVFALFPREVQPHVAPCLWPWVRVLPASDDRDLIRCSCPHALPGRSAQRSPIAALLGHCSRDAGAHQRGQEEQLLTVSDHFVLGSRDGQFMAFSFSNRLVALGPLFVFTEEENEAQKGQVTSPRPLSG